MRRPSDDKRPPIETFPDLDVTQIALEMLLERLGAERGVRDEPPSSSSSIDEIESRIIERVEAEKKSSHALVEDEMRTYLERLAALDFEAFQRNPIGSPGVKWTPDFGPVVKV